MSLVEVLVSVDIVVLCLNFGYGLELLLICCVQVFFVGQWVLFGVLVNGCSVDYSFDDVVVCVLCDKVWLELVYIEQVVMVGNVVCDLCGWLLSVFYLVLVGLDIWVEDDDFDFVLLCDVCSECFVLLFDYV